MAFTVPTFNLTSNIWRSANPPPGIPDVVVSGNLAWGRRVSSYQGLVSGLNEPLMTLLLPPGTDVRSPACATGADTVEVPAGSGRFYIVIGVDDIGKGFPNEHRAAVLSWTSVFGFWPVPIP